MGYTPKEKVDITSNTVKVIYEKVSENRTLRIRIVDWGVSGKNYRLLEKREFFNKDGQEMQGKAKGFNIEDLERLKVDWDEIMVTMAGEPEKKAEDEFPV